MPRLILPLVFLTSFFIHGCKTNSVKKPTTLPKASQPILAISVWPDHWQSLISRLDQWGKIAKPPVVLSKKAELASLWALLASLPISPNAAVLSEKIPHHLSPEHPITIELYPPRIRFEEVLLRGLQNPKSKLTPQIQVRLSVPTQDPHKLLESIRTSGLAFEKDSPNPIFTTENTVTRATVLQSSVVFDTIALDTSRVKGTEQWRQFFGRAPVKTPEPAFSRNTDSAARVMLHSFGIAEMSAAVGVFRALSAYRLFSSQGGTEGSQLLAEGLAEILDGFLFADPSVSVAHSMFVDVPVAPKARMEIAWQLSKVGLRAFRAGGITGKPTDVSSVAWKEVIEAVELSPRSAAIQDLDEVVSLFQVGAPFVWPYLSLGNALQLLKTLKLSGRIHSLLKEAQEKSGLHISKLNGQLQFVDDDLLVLNGSADADKRWNQLTPATITPAFKTAQRCLSNAWLGIMRAGYSISESPEVREKAWSAAGRTIKESTACAKRFPPTEQRYQDMQELFNQLRQQIQAR